MRLKFLSLAFVFAAGLFAAVPSGSLAADIPAASASGKKLSALERVAAGDIPSFADDGDLESLKKSVASSLSFYEALPSTAVFHFGADVLPRDAFLSGLKIFHAFLQNNPGPSEIDAFVKKEFDVYRAAGVRGSSVPVLYSSYYEHTLKARLAPDREYRYPLYARPPDLVDVPMENFDSRRKGERVVGRVEGGSLVPYYSREEIDSRGVLKGRGLEIAWARDPLDIAFLQVQGSGWIEIPDSTQTYHIRYAGDNGLKFKSIGTRLIETGAIPRAAFSRERMVDHMHSLSESEQRAVLNANPRYIFFELVSSTHLTRGSLMVPLTAGRSVATDPKIYPQGALAWIETQKPSFDGRGAFAGPQKMRRFVLNQDEGGAIQGPGRVDFFAGGGALAEKTAMRLWYPGRLYFFLKKGTR